MDLHPTRFRIQMAQIVADPDFLDRAVADYEREWTKRREDRRRASQELQAVRRARFYPEVTLTAEDRYEERMQLASGALLRAIEGVRQGLIPETPSDLVWSLSSGEDVFNCHGGHGGEYAPRQITIGPNREPCPMCGVRADIGCKHSARGF